MREDIGINDNREDIVGLRRHSSGNPFYQNWTSEFIYNK